MKKKEKILLLILVILIFVVFSLFLVSKKSNFDNELEGTIINNTNKDVISEKEVFNVLFSDIKYTYNGEKTIISFDITNNNDKDITLFHFIINVYDKDNNLIGEFNPVSKALIESNSTLNNFEVRTSKDLSKAHSIKFELSDLKFFEEEIEE